jgi:hypothetical protein
MLEKPFINSHYLNIKDFTNVIENVCSDIFLFILVFLYKHRPFTKSTLLNYEKAKFQGKNFIGMSKSPTMSSAKFIVSPNLKSKFSPCITITKSPTLKDKKHFGLKYKNQTDSRNFLMRYAAVKKNGKEKEDKEEDTIKELINFMSDKKKTDNSKKLNGFNSSNENEDSTIDENVIIKSIPVSRKNRNNLKEIKTNKSATHLVHNSDSSVSQNEDGQNDDDVIQPAVKYRTQGIAKSISDSENIKSLFKGLSIAREEDENLSSDEDLLAKDEVLFEGYLYKLTQTHKLKKLFFKLVHKDMYYYKTSEDKVHKGMHNLSGVFLKEEPSKLIDGFTFRCFSVIYPKKVRKYYTDQVIEYNSWISALRKATEHQILSEIYELKDTIGKGKFGLVKLGIHKQTKRKVAIKIINKKCMTVQDSEMVKTEIEILKVCQHPNIIRLYDIFENVDYIYIIMEYGAGGDLFSYIEKRGFKLSESRAAQIIHKLCTAIYYLHSYGITHRDLKPENILMTDDTDEADLKILDFGLSKMIGPNEYCTEPFGTLVSD